jgi:hypothetical protein
MTAPDDFEARLRETLRDAEQSAPVPPGLADRIVDAATEAGRGSVRPLWRRLSPRGGTWPPLLAAAAVVLILAGGALAIRLSEGPRRSTTADAPPSSAITLPSTAAPSPSAPRGTQPNPPGESDVPGATGPGTPTTSDRPSGPPATSTSASTSASSSSPAGTAGATPLPDDPALVTLASAAPHPELRCSPFVGAFSVVRSTFTDGTPYAVVALRCNDGATVTPLEVSVYTVVAGTPTRLGVLVAGTVTIDGGPYFAVAANADVGQVTLRYQSGATDPSSYQQSFALSATGAAGGPITPV